MCSNISDNRQKKRISLTIFLPEKGYNSFKSILIGNETIDKIDESDERFFYSLYLIFILGAVSLGTLFLLNVVINYFLDKGEVFGQFGDFLGGVLNPIFTLMTFLGVIITIILQRLELRATRDEYQKSASALSTQAIENTFFNMLTLHHKIVEKTHISATSISQNLDFLFEPHKKSVPSLIGDKPCQGAEAFTRLLYLIKNDEDKQKTLDEYKFLQENHNHIFGSYFRNLYQIMKFIHHHGTADGDEKKKYMGILRAQLSTDELIALFINCSGNMVDNGEFRELLVEYHMLEHMPLFYNKEQSKYYTSQMAVIADADSIKEFLSPTNNGAFGKKEIWFPPLS